MKTSLFVSVLATGCMLCVDAAWAAERDQACPPSVIERIGRVLELDHFKPRDDEGIVVSSACKAWPMDSQLLIAAVAYDQGEESRKSLFLAVIRVGDGLVVASHRGSIGEDAVVSIYGGSLRIDTARYELSPGVRAFGLDIASGTPGPRCAEGGLGPTRSLYVVEKEHIRPVLEEVWLSHWWFVKGSNPACSPVETEDDEIEQAGFSIAVGAGTTNGFKDLVITGTSRVPEGHKARRKPLKVRLRYDGTRYPNEALVDDILRWRSDTP
ncbi:PA3715 family protein [Piscinibacter terrae]|uniref:Uncharacterized protein n=1 Tax=Piscinibacter terrae TaxID=2496871 RepID=A0A3N7HL06_9BURK|nr:hypothetical protein [Albitalea terrae]RQP21251.1 hypothetical protein DZC73_28870 [Albitalea terrae]